MILFLWMVGLFSILMQQSAPPVTIDTLPNLQPETIVQSTFPVFALAISPDGGQSAYGGESNLIYILDVE